jgi:uncharacterized protein
VTRYLLDINLLIALAWPQHIHHAQAHAWFGKTGHQAWATCPVTQLGFIRISSNSKIIPAAVSPREAIAMLDKISSLAGHEFWPDDVAPVAASTFASLALVGHRQVTDAYVLALAQHHKAALATFDRGMVELIAGTDRTRYVTVVDVQ